MKKLIEMLRYMRPEGSICQEAFCDRFLEPVMGSPDTYGNYITTIGDNPVVCFTAHHDTVHKIGGFQNLTLRGDTVHTKDSNCLGADCTTGVWLILEMIEAQIPGIYIVHAGEESGCIGSRALVDSCPPFLETIKAVISFDRRGYDSIVTHQMGSRTASNAFAESLSNILGLGMSPDDTGSYTDSNEYANLVSECTNISVGYFNQHTRYEYQDLSFARELRDALLAADWSKLVFQRDPFQVESRFDRNNPWFYEGPYVGYRSKTQKEKLLELIEFYPEGVAEVLLGYGIDYDYLHHDLEMEGFIPLGAY